MSSRENVSNQTLLEALIEYKQQLAQASIAGLTRPRIPDYIGECFLKIAERLSCRHNFVHYPFRDDMISNGVENCVTYVANFNPEKSVNPFAYFTQIIWYAFLRRIAKEEKYLYVKYKCLQNTAQYVNQAHDDKSYDNTYVDFLRKNMDEIITDFEGKKAKGSHDCKAKKLAALTEIPQDVLEEIAS